MAHLLPFLPQARALLDLCCRFPVWSLYQIVRVSAIAGKQAWLQSLQGEYVSVRIQIYSHSVVAVPAREELSLAGAGTPHF
jgi:hypothetical protein